MLDRLKRTNLTPKRHAFHRIVAGGFQRLFRPAKLFKAQIYRRLIQHSCDGLSVALQGLGGTARMVILPHESHGYRARESVLHTLYESFEWFDTHVKGADTRLEDVEG